MKTMKVLCLSVLGLCLVFLTACNTVTPRQYFEKAVLNTNTFADFGTEHMMRELTSAQPAYPATKMMEHRAQRVEMVLNDLKTLRQTEETKDMVQTSIALHEYILPIYKNEYMALARLCDNKAPKEEIDAKEEEIVSKYGQKVDELFSKLTDIGKEYAKKNDINVTWGH
ncbi:hypothetical protein [Chitinophaga tropicalis]|uniref:Lipoprotein n=1 Tax=Chitinophaga tropicalis TaxID=2683588 RepID=A0A7K1U610_9BACT|nr:hypothetical protein [Chitinophaga tropicalis]MVT09395.1 hypothetical protein [Chitinophaga tropicalis]